MLRFKQLKLDAKGTAAAAARYYESHDAKARLRGADEYYSAAADVEAPRWWTPPGAPESFGVRNGAVAEPGQLRNLLAGRHAETDKMLVRTVKKKERTPGWDGGFSVPKTVSCLYAAGTDAQKRAILRDVTESAVVALNALWSEPHRGFEARRGAKGAREVPVDGVALIVPHVTARIAEGNKLPDPQLHVHALVLNLGLRGSDGRVSSLDPTRGFKEAPSIGCLFHAELAQRLERNHDLRVIEVPGIERQKLPSFEVAGVDPVLKHEFSSRSREMLMRIATREEGTGVAFNGKVRAQQTASAAQVGRKRKQRHQGDDLGAHWQARMRDRGHAPERVWEAAREQGRDREKERPLLSAAEVVALKVKERRGQMPEHRQRREVYIAAQTRGIGAAGAIAEFRRLVAVGWERLAERAGRIMERARELKELAIEQVRGQWRSGPTRGGGGGRAHEAERPRDRERGRGMER